MLEKVKTMQQLTPAMIKLIELDKKEAEIKKFYEERSEILKQIKEEIGVGGMFQSPTGEVFAVEECEGKFIRFDPLSYRRTRNINDPKQGGNFLSKIVAKNAGFDV